MQKTNTAKQWKIIALILAIALISSMFIILYKPDNVKAQPVTLNVAISGKAELGVNEVGTYTANVNNSQGDLVYFWSINPENDTTLTSFGDKCNVTFTKATTENYILVCSIKDSNSNSGIGFLNIKDPATLPDYYLDSSTADYSYKISTDGLGWAYVVNGTNGQVVTAWSSTNASCTVNSASNSLSGTYWQTILLNGVFSLSASITSKAYTKWIVVGTVNSSITNPSFPLLRNLDQTNGNSYIEVNGGTWDNRGGASGMQTTNGNTFDFRGGIMYGIKIHDTNVINPAQDGFHLVGCFESYIYNNKVSKANGYAYYLPSFSDSFMFNNDGLSYQSALYLSSSSTSQFNNNYFGGTNTNTTGGYNGQLQLTYCEGNQFTNTRIDASASDGVTFLFSNNNVFTGLTVTSPYVDNVGTAVNLGAANNNTITGLFVGMNTGGSTNQAYKWLYGVHVWSTSTANTVSGKVNNAYTVKLEASDSTGNSYDLNGYVTAYNYESTEPMGAYTYMIYQDGANYKAKAANGSICFTSTNQTEVERLALISFSGTNGTVVMNNLKHNSSLTIPLGVLVWSNYGGNVPILWNNSGQISLVGTNGTNGTNGTWNWALVNATFGKTDIGASTAGFGGSARCATKFSLSQTGTIYTISVYFDTSSGTGNAQMGIWDDNSGVPNNLLMASASFAVPVSGWYTAALISPYTATSGYYWIGFSIDNSISIKYEASGSSYWTNGSSLNNPFGTANSWSNTASIYASYAHS
jgi:hypothetical protein